MTSEQIDSFLNSRTPATKNKMVTISFKIRNTIRGFFPDTNDSEELKLKNFWRVIIEGNLDQWKETESLSLTRIFSGSDITKLKF